MKMIDLLVLISQKKQPRIIKVFKKEWEWFPVGMNGGNYYRDVFGGFDTLGHYANLSEPDTLNKEVKVIEE